MSCSDMNGCVEQGWFRFDLGAPEAVSQMRFMAMLRSGVTGTPMAAANNGYFTDPAAGLDPAAGFSLAWQNRIWPPL